MDIKPSIYENELANKKLQIRMLAAASAGLAMLAACAMYGWKSTQLNQVLHVPPDLSAGAQIKTGDVPPPTVYAFAYYMMQQLNRWPENGEVDAGKNTDECKVTLQKELDLKSKRGELSLRTRIFTELPGAGYEDKRVEKIGKNNKWWVQIDSEIEERQNGILIKKVPIRYTVKVIAVKADYEQNPWNLAIDCFDPERPPRKLELQDDKANKTSSTGTASVNNTPATTQSTNHSSEGSLP
jgi:integrating conjugative element protein (TIGR03746 family)